ncbi:MAG: hypothetical protein ABIC95_05375 [archaeon]
MKKTLAIWIVSLLLTISAAWAADGLSISGLPGTVSADPGDAIETSYTLSNTGTTDLDVSVLPITMSDGTRIFSLSGTPSMPTGFLSGTAQTVNISGFVPAGQRAGAYSGLVNTTGGNASASFTFNLNVDSVPNASVNDMSMTVLQGQSGNAAMTVTNTGNDDISVTLFPSTLYREGGSEVITASQINFIPSAFAVAYNNAGSSTVTVAVPSTAVNGTYKGNMTISFGTKQVTSELTVIVQQPTSAITTSLDRIEVIDRPGDAFSTTFTVQNTGTTTLTSLIPSVDGLTTFNISISPASFDLTSGQSRIVTVKGNIADDIDTTQGGETGTIRVSNAQVSKDIVFVVNGEQMAELYRVDVYVNNKRSRVEDGDTVDKIEPGDTIKFRFEVENNWPDNRDEDFDINNIEISLLVKDIDDGDDIDETIDMDDLSAGDRDTVEFEFTVPYNTDEDDFDFEIILTAEDENDAQYETEMRGTLTVERESHKILLSDVDINPISVSCDRTVFINAEVINIGTKDEQNVVLEATSSSLGVEEQVTGISLSDNPDDDDNTYRANFVLDIPDNKRAGTYRITVNAFRDRTDLDDSELLTIEVMDCASSIPDDGDDDVTPPVVDDKDTGDDPTDKGDDTTVIVTPPVVTPPTGGVIVPPQVTKDEGFVGSTTYMVMLIVIIVLLLVGVVALIGVLMKKN